MSKDNTKVHEVREVAAPGTGNPETVYVTIPATDIFDSQHPGVNIIGGTEKEELPDGRWVRKKGGQGSNIKFEAGKTYEVPLALGREVEARLAMFHKESVRLLRPKTDQKSINQVNNGSLWAKGAGFGLDNEAELNSRLDPGEKVVTVKW